MDLRQLRIDLGKVAQTAGYNAWDYTPDDPQNLPAAVVGGIRSMVRLNALTTQIQVEVTFYVSAADPKDAAGRLDLALSVGLDGSFIDCLDTMSEAPNTPSWRSVRLDSAGPYQRVLMPGGGAALSVAIVLELTA